MEKVKLTKEQAASLEDASKHHDNVKIIRIHMDVPVMKAWYKGSAHLNELSLDTLIRALYIGYEVEKTEDEILLEHYESCTLLCGLNCAGYEQSSFRAGMETALNIIGKTVPGIND